MRPSEFSATAFPMPFVGFGRVNDAEFRILARLRRANGRTVAYRELCLLAWGPTPARGERNRLKNVISRLRRKLGEDSEIAITCQRGRGYSLHVRTPPAPETNTSTTTRSMQRSIAPEINQENP